MTDPKLDATPLVDQTAPTKTTTTTVPSPDSTAPIILANGNGSSTVNASKTAAAYNVKLGGNTPNSTAPPRPRPRLLKTGHSTPNMNGPLYMQTSGSNIVLVRRLKRKEESTWKHLARWFVENQIGTFLIQA